MAGDWIKMRTDLYRDPKVCMMADALLNSNGDLARYVNQHCQRDMTVTRNVMRNVTVGALVSVWGVMRVRGKAEGGDLVCRSAAIGVIDDIADLPGFGAAMVLVGWIIETDEGLVFPGFFDEHNVDPEAAAKQKAAERQKRYRDKQKRESDVTRDVTRDVTVTHREEKSREENKEEKPLSGKPDPDRPPKPENTAGREVIEYLNRKVGTRYQPVEANLKFIRARMEEGATAEEIRRVIDVKAQEWLGTEQAKYLRPETLFNATKYASYAGQIGANGASVLPTEKRREVAL